MTENTSSTWPPFHEYRLTEHARFQMERRSITEAEIAQVLTNPEQTERVGEKRIVCQSRFQRGTPPQLYLLRVFVDVGQDPPVVVTAYWTSKVEKYWR